MKRRTVVDRDAAHINEDTESAYVKMFTTDMVILYGERGTEEEWMEGGWGGGEREKGE